MPLLPIRGLIPCDALFFSMQAKSRWLSSMEAVIYLGQVTRICLMLEGL